MKIVLKWLFGRGTRSVQIINLFTNIIWAFLFIFSSCTLVSINLPLALENTRIVTILSITTVILTFIGFNSVNYKRQLFKVAGLISGALTQAIISSYYITACPPFEPMLIVCSLLSTWFLLSVIYIAYVEGMDGNYRSD